MLRFLESSCVGFGFHLLVPQFLRRCGDTRTLFFGDTFRCVGRVVSIVQHNSHHEWKRADLLPACCVNLGVLAVCPFGGPFGGPFEGSVGSPCGGASSLLTLLRETPLESPCRGGPGVFLLTLLRGCTFGSPFGGSPEFVCRDCCLWALVLLSEG